MKACELILGGQKSGKSRRAEALAQAWLQADPAHQACLLATAQALDAEMQARIARHQADRAQRCPGLRCVEVGLDLAQAVRAHSRADTLLVVDCLPLWLTRWAMCCEQNSLESPDWLAQRALFFEAMEQAPGPLVLVSNEIGLGVIPLGPEVRVFVDALGALHQALAQRCSAVTLMVAGCALPLRPAPGGGA